MMIEFKNVSLTYDNKAVLNNFSYAFKENNVYLLLGKSGSGKTSLLKLCARLEKNYQGTILINQKYSDLFSDSDYSNLVHFVFQNYVLFNHLTVLENIIFFIKLVDNRKEKELIEQATYFLNYFNLSTLKNSYIQTLSGGEKQRVALIRSFVKNPLVFLLDEPTSALDKGNTDLLINLILELKNKGKIFIISSQDFYLIDQLKSTQILF